MGAKLLIAEDEARLRVALKEYFEREGFEVTTADDGAQALALLDDTPPNIIILDVQLPQVDGLDVCRTARQKLGQGIGIVMISGIKKETLDRIVGLEIGADVYLTKPFETRELLAQVRALARHIQAAKARDDSEGWHAVDDHLRIHFERRLVEAGGQAVHLTRLEFELLKYLVEHPGVPCARADLMDAVWGYAEPSWEVSDAAVNTCIAKLRAKIEPDPTHPRYIQSVHGVGYCFKHI